MIAPSSRTIAVATVHVLADTREQAIPPFPDGVTFERFKLDSGDYSTLPLLHLARIERKNAGDFASSLTHERDRFERELARLQRFRHRLIVVEGDLADYLDGRMRSNVHPSAIVGSVCTLYARFGVATLFAHDAATCGRIIAGILRRLEEQHAPKGRAAA